MGRGRPPLFLIQEILMGFFQDFVEGFTNGVQSMLANGSSRGQEHGRIERLCREIGWTVNERDAEVIRLHFNGPHGEIRKVSIRSGDADVALFMVFSMAFVRTVPQPVMEYLLMRPIDLRFGSWIVSCDDDGDV